MKRTSGRGRVSRAVPLIQTRPIRRARWTTRGDEAASASMPQVERQDGDDEEGGANASGC